MRKGYSKTNLFRKKSNTNIHRSFNDSLRNESNEMPISKQVDIQRQQEVKRKKFDTEIRQATKYNIVTNYKELLKTPMFFAKVDLLRIETNNERLGNSKKLQTS